MFIVNNNYVKNQSSLWNLLSMTFLCKVFVITQQAQDVDPVLVWCQPTIYDTGPASHLLWVNVSCLLGMNLWARKVSFARRRPCYFIHSPEGVADSPGPVLTWPCDMLKYQGKRCVTVLTYDHKTFFIKWTKLYKFQFNFIFHGVFDLYQINAFFLLIWYNVLENMKILVYKII